MISGSSRFAARPWDAAAAEAWARSLAEDLVAPPAVGSVRDAAAVWRIERIRVACRRPHDFADYPELSVRVRGAFGRALAAIPPRSPGGWSRPAAFAILFGSAGRWASGLEIPKPVVVRALVERDRLVAEVSLFGAAGVFADEAAEALVRALAGGIAIAPESRHRVRLEPLEVQRERIDGIDPPARATAASLIFRSPVAVRSGRRLKADPAAILRAVLLRVSAMARWQGVTFAADWPALHRMIGEAAVDDSALIPAWWQRYSQRRGAEPIPMAGWVGPLRLAGRLDALIPFLAIAATCNAGSHAALGLGWYDLAAG